MTIWRLVASSVSKATRAQAHAHACALTPSHTHPYARTELYNIFAFPRRQGLRECYVIRTLPLLLA